MRDGWMKQLAGESSMEELKHVVSMVRKDVLRTDRAHRFYAGGDDCHNVISLFHLLVTYAVAHPKVSYCQVCLLFLSDGFLDKQFITLWDQNVSLLDWLILVSLICSVVDVVL